MKTKKIFLRKIFRGCNKVLNLICSDKSYLIVVRYFVLLGFMFSLGLIYWMFTPLTISSVVWLLGFIFEKIVVKGDIIAIRTSFVQIVPACVAGSAYLLLLILNLSVSIGWKKRIKSILLSFLVLFVLNVLRIVLLTWMYVEGNAFFDFSHKLFWYGLSTVFVVGIWFFMVKRFKIKEIPFYSDVKFFLKGIKR